MDRVSVGPYMIAQRELRSPRLEEPRRRLARSERFAAEDDQPQARAAASRATAVAASWFRATNGQKARRDRSRTAREIAAGPPDRRRTWSRDEDHNVPPRAPESPNSSQNEKSKRRVERESETFGPIGANRTPELPRDQIRDDGGVRHSNPLGYARRAGSVDDIGQVVRGRERGRVGVAHAGEGRGVGVQAQHAGGAVGQRTAAGASGSAEPVRRSPEAGRQVARRGTRGRVGHKRRPP